MSNFLAVATVTAALQRMLQESAAIDVPEARVSTARPDIRQNGATGSGVNVFLYQVFLYQVTPHAALCDVDLPTGGAGGRLVRRPQAALDLHYLLSFYGDDTLLVPQRLLGSTVRTLHARPVLTPDVIKAVVDAAGAEQPIHPDLARSDLADQIELVRLTPLPLSLEQLSNLWSVLVQTPYVLSVAYQASVVLIEDALTPRPVLPVRESELVLTPLESNQASSAPPPKVTAVSANGSPASSMTVMTNVVLGRGQQVVLRLFDRSHPKGQHRFDTLVRDDETKQVDVPISGVASGTYLVQVYIDGAASQLERGEDGNLAGREVTLG